MKKILYLFCLVLTLLLKPAMASEAEYPLDSAPDRTSDVQALQRGAKLFINHCLNCHGASMVRYNRLQDLGLDKEQIETNLLYTADKIGEMMQVSMPVKMAKKWFGAAPPDLSLIARARGTDWLYTYLRTFYRDPSRETGWNNLVFPNVGMPHVLWEMSGEKILVSEHGHLPAKLELVNAGTMTQDQYDSAVADLVSFMAWMAEPKRNERVRLGFGVMAFLLVFTLLAWRLNKAYWKDIH